MNSDLSTIPSLSISTSVSTSRASSVLSTSPATSDSPYYYYTSPTSVSSSPIHTTTTAHPTHYRQSHRSLEKRSHSASVRLPRRTSTPLLPPQRSASAGSTLLKDSTSSTLYHHHHQQQCFPSSSSSLENNVNKNDKSVRYNIKDDSGNKVSTSFDQISPMQQPSEQRWDDSQLAMELADDLPSSPTLSTRENIKIKVRQWITPTIKQRRRPIHKWFADRVA